MQKLLSILCVLLFVGIHSNAQEQKLPVGKVQSTRDCNDLNVHAKLIDLNKELEAKQYQLAYFASGNMPSKDLMSVRLECKAGEKYEIRYVLGANASRYQLNVIDPNVTHVVKAKDKNDSKEMMIVKEHFTATTNGVYVIIYSQLNKNENCVGLSVFKK